MTELRHQEAETGPWVDADPSPRDRPSPIAPHSEGARDRARGRQGNQLAVLMRSIELAIVPRLMRNHPRPGAGISEIRSNVSSPTEDDVSRFADLVLAPREEVALAYVEALRDRGMTLETVYVGLLGPTATRLGDYWCDDRCSFTEVTLGLWRLQQLIRELSPDFHREAAGPARSGLHALLVPVPGEQHSFGLLMVAEFFRRAGWVVTGGPFANHRQMVGAVRDEWFAVIGFSIAAERHLDSIATGIRLVRRASRNRAIGVMVGGPLIVEHPELVVRLGADATAIDAPQAVALAQALAATSVPQE